MLRNRIYLGELHFGKLRQPESLHADHRPRPVRTGQAHGDSRAAASPSRSTCWPDSESFAAARAARGLSAMKLPRQNDYRIYRCPSTSPCDHHMTVSADIAERVVVDAAKAALSDVEGRASALESARAAVEALERGAGGAGRRDAVVRHPGPDRRGGRRREAGRDSRPPGTRHRNVSISRATRTTAITVGVDDWDDARPLRSGAT